MATRTEITLEDFARAIETWDLVQMVDLETGEPVGEPQWLHASHVEWCQNCNVPREKCPHWQ